MMNPHDALIDKIRVISYRGREADWAADRSLIEKAVADSLPDPPIIRGDRLVNLVDSLYRPRIGGPWDALVDHGIK